jgi:hypothetical protein
MKRTSTVLAALATLLLSAPPSVHAQAAAQQEMQYAQFLVGTWSCAHTVGDFAGTYTTTVASALDNRWLKQTYDFPASGERAGPIHAEYFIGYDPRVQRWLRFGAMTDGQYFAMVAKRNGDVWTWGYVLPGTAGSAVYTKKSDSEFTVDGPSYPSNGTTVTEHHTCRKAS